MLNYKLMRPGRRPTHEHPIDIGNPKAYAKQIFDRLDVAEATRADYVYRLGLFLDFIKKHGFHRNSFLDFKQYLAERTNLQSPSKNKYLATAKVFLKELNRQGYLPTDITQNVKAFTQNKKHKREGFNEAEVKQISKTLRQLKPTPNNTRLKALFCLLALQGLRQIEIVRLNFEDLYLSQSVAFIRGKGQDDKERIHLLPETVSALQEHLTANKVQKGALFKSLGNRKSERITTMTIKRELRRILQPLQLKKTVHGFRHYYVTMLLKCLDLRDVRKFSRHRSLEMLIVYDDEIDIQQKVPQVLRCFKGVNVCV
jgi:integrase